MCDTDTPILIPEIYPEFTLKKEDITPKEAFARDWIKPYEYVWADYWDDDYGARLELDIIRYQREQIHRERREDWYLNNPFFLYLRNHLPDDIYDFLQFCYRKNRSAYPEYAGKPLTEVYEKYQRFRTIELTFIEAIPVHFEDYTNIINGQESVQYINQYGAFYSILTSSFSQLIMNHWKEHARVSDSKKKTRAYIAYIASLKIICNMFLLINGLDLDIPMDGYTQIDKYYHSREHLNIITEAGVSPYIYKMAEVFFYSAYNISIILRSIRASKFIKAMEINRTHGEFLSQLGEIRAKVQSSESLISNMGMMKSGYQMTMNAGCLKWSEVSASCPYDNEEYIYKVTDEDIHTRMVSQLNPYDYCRINNICNKLVPFCFKETDDRALESECISLLPMMTNVLNFFHSMPSILLKISTNGKPIKKAETIIFNYEKFLVTSHSMKDRLIACNDRWIAENRTSYNNFIRSISLWQNPALSVRNDK